MTIERLLNPNPKLVQEFEGMAQTKAEFGLPFRLAETNSCYHGGKRGVSDTFASALWGADLMYQLASAGGAGINFHGGGYGVVHADRRHGGEWVCGAADFLRHAVLRSRRERDI